MSAKTQKSAKAKPAAKPKPTAPAKPKPKATPKLSPGKTSANDFVAVALAKSKQPMTIGQLLSAVTTAGWNCGGKTPRQSLSAAVQQEIKSKGKAARFKRAGRGLFVASKEATR